MMRRLIGGALVAALLVLSPLAAAAQTSVILRKPDNSGPLSFNDIRAVDVALASSLNAAITVPTDYGLGTISGYVYGIAGGATPIFEISNDVTSSSPHWTAVTVWQGNTILAGSTLTADGPFNFALPAHTSWRIRTSVAGSGAMHVSYSMSATPSEFRGAAALASQPVGGATRFGFITTASTNCQTISAGQHTLLSLSVTGLNTTVGYVRPYDTATTPTPSSSTGTAESYAVIGSATALGGQNVPLPAAGLQFSNGVSFCVTGGPTNTDATNGPAGILVNGSYK